MKPKKILVVEDELGPREALRIILQKSFEVTTASSAKETLLCMEKSEFDLITVDLKLPDMLGIQLLKTLRDRIPKTELMVITGFGSFDNMVELYLMGIPLIMIKPFDIAHLIHVIQLAFNRKKIIEHIDRFIGWLKEKNTGLQGSSYHGLNRKIFQDLRRRIIQIENITGHFTGYANQVWELSKQVAVIAGLSEQDMAILKHACYLHHLGKMGFCYPVSTRSRLKNAAEEILIKTYPHHTAKLLEGCNLPEQLLQVLLHCEEHYDGSGYPGGIYGNQIPLCSQILHFSNHIVSVRNDFKQQNKPYTERDCAGIARELQGKSLSPALVDIYCEMVAASSGVKDQFTLEGNNV
jgi:putative two-component system response regulator